LAVADSAALSSPTTGGQGTAEWRRAAVPGQQCVAYRRRERRGELPKKPEYHKLLLDIILWGLVFVLLGVSAILGWIVLPIVLIGRMLG
jgi:hypothetical protein